MNTGEFKGKVISISVNLSEERPALITRIKLEDNTPLNHIIRLNHPDSQRIGFDELRSAFPTQLGNLNDEELLVYLLSKTSVFDNMPVNVGVEPQMKNGIVQKADNGTPYYNVRLRSAVKNLTNETASALAKRLLAFVTSKRETDTVFGESQHA